MSRDRKIETQNNLLSAMPRREFAPAGRGRSLKRWTLSIAMPTVAVLLASAADPNAAAACRGSGISSRGSDGVITTRWSDGAYTKKYTDGSLEWSYPAGSDPVPGASPGHKPGPGPSPGHAPGAGPSPGHNPY
jgi:hypothetical protein